MLKIKNKRSLKRGSEAVENILIIGIIIAVIVTAFYPSIQTLVGNIFNGLNVWVSNNTASLFQ